MGKTIQTLDGSLKSSLGYAAAGHSHTLASLGAAASSHSHNAITSRGNVACESGVTARPAVAGLSMSQAYNNNYPTPYGNVINLRGTGDGQILVGWPGTDGAHAPVYVRSKRDNTSTANWSDWAQVYTTANKPTYSAVGAAAASHGTHVDYATAAPKAHGTAAVGSSSKVAREDHVHPIQTSVAQLTTARNIQIGNKTNSFNGTANISYTLDDIGAVARYTAIGNIGAAGKYFTIFEVADQYYEHQNNYLLSINRTYNSPNNESYIFLIVGAYQKANITQLASKVNGQLLEEVRIVMNATNASSTKISKIEVKLKNNPDYKNDWYATLTPLSCNATVPVCHDFIASDNTGTTIATLAPSTTGMKLSEGEFNGNAATATTATSAGKLTTARTLTIGNTGKSFDGSANVSWSLSDIGAQPAKRSINFISDHLNDWNSSSAMSGKTYAGGWHGNTGTAEGYLSFGNSGDQILHMFVDGDYYARENKKVFHEGNLQPTVAKLATARTLTIGSKGKTFDGSANVSWSLSEIGAAASSHTHSNIINQDTRDVNTTPDGAPLGLSVHLKNNGKDGLTDGGTYHSSLFIKGWNDYSGGPYGNLAITANNNLWFRASSSGTAWNSWKKVSLDDHTHTPASIGAAAASHGTHLTIGTGASNAAAGNHKHGLLHDNLTVELANTTTDNGWSMINSSYNGYLLKSIRFNANVPPWAAGGYGSGIAFGGGDTKGVMSMQYSSPLVKFAGGNGSKPVWNIGITGTSGKNYNLEDINSLGGQLTVANGNIGTLSSLKTSAKGNLVAAINEVFQSGNNVKQKLVDALVAKGMDDVSTSMSFDEIIDNIKLFKDYLNIKADNINKLAGYYNTFVIKNDGTLWAAGDNREGPLGAGSSITLGSFTKIYVSDIKQIQTSISGGHTVILKKDGTVWTCGYNNYGQLGLMDNENRTTFTQTNLTDVKSIACGSYHTFALKNDGTVWACGRNSYGQLGTGGTTSDKQNSFIKITTNISNVAKICCGSTHTMILRTDGTLYTAGENLLGQLGLGNTTNQSTFTKVNISNVKDIEAGLSFSMLIKDDGTLWTSGDNRNGQLGIGSTASKTSFTQVNISDVKLFRAGRFHSIVLKNDGTLWGCGYNSYGQLGTGSTKESVVSFTKVTPNSGPIVNVYTGFDHTVIVDNEGVVYGTGTNYNGALGLGVGTMSQKYTSFTPISQLT